MSWFSKSVKGLMGSSKSRESGSHEYVQHAKLRIVGGLRWPPP